MPRIGDTLQRFAYSRNDSRSVKISRYRIHTAGLRQLHVMLASGMSRNRPMAVLAQPALNAVAVVSFAYYGDAATSAASDAGLVTGGACTVVGILADKFLQCGYSLSAFRFAHSSECFADFGDEVHVVHLPMRNYNAATSVDVHIKYDLTEPNHLSNLSAYYTSDYNGEMDRGHRNFFHPLF